MTQHENMSFFSRISQDASNAFQDAYGNFVLGDDAGKSARLVLVLKPKLGERIDLGMTFIEINGRAYVRTVSPASQAARAGVMPRDSIQFASVYESDFDDFDDEDVATDLDESATSYALGCETRGMRITYEELRRLLADGLDPMQSAFLSPPSSTTAWSGPPIPSTINVCSPAEDEFHRPLTPFRGETPKPVVFVLRRTRQRSSSGGLNFRLDDECDFASSLIRRLAPTADMEAPNPDTWDELVHDGTDWLLGTGSMLPPMHAAPDASLLRREEDSGIPLDNYERQRAIKLANLRSRMAAEAVHFDRGDDVEAATIRGMIQKAVGLAFVRASKVVLGVSIHGGSGIVIARLSDGTWSAPSAIGTWGLGFGIQFGLEVAEYIFILQTQESLDHFRKGSSFNIGGNVGAAVAGMGREAYGAASVGSICTKPAQQQVKEDEYNDDEDSDAGGKEHTTFGIAPIVAYAKSQGLYVGVSLEGSRIFTRTDVNARAYKFATGREVTAKDILSGKVATPPEAEDLYAALHSVEFTHEMSCLPRPPEILRQDSPNSWHYNRSTLGSSGNGSISVSGKDPFTFLKKLSRDEAEECETFETQFKKFMYGGVSVQRLLPDSESRSGKTRKERRTLWLMLPEVGALRLGFVSKLSDGEGAVSNKSSTQRVKRDTGDYSLPGWEGDLATVASEEVTLDSALLEKDTSASQIRVGDVQLSTNHSVALTDVTVLSQESNVPIRFSSEDKTEHLRIISIQDVSGTTLLFLANNFREAELLNCGLKLLLERETARLGVRGGLPISALGGKVMEGAMSPAAARGFKEPPMPGKSSRRSKSGYSSSEMGEDSSTIGDSSTQNVPAVPEGRKKWGNVPGRNYMREKAAMSTPTRGMDSKNEYGATNGHGAIKYVHGQCIVRDIATNIHLPLPLPLCRVLLLDSSSPVIEKWEDDRGDKNFSRTDWTFPPATPRELERHSSEHQLIASGSMMGAHRTTTFDRLRNGSLVHLSETQIIDADDSEKLAFTISERMPRRGFSMKVKVLLRSSKDNSCEATVLGEVRPVGKNMTNQAAVHKAFLLVLNEIKVRYGSEGKGLMASFLSVVRSLPNPESAASVVGRRGRKSGKSRGKSEISPPFQRTAPSRPSDKGSNGSSGRSKSRPESGLVSFDDIMNARHDLPPQREPVRSKEMERPMTPSMQKVADSDPNFKHSSKAEKEKKYLASNEFAELPVDEQEDYIRATQNKTIEVKPLPKIRLSLMPAPREEDEEDSEKSSGANKKKKKSSRRKGLSHSSSGRKSSRR